MTQFLQNKKELLQSLILKERYIMPDKMKLLFEKPKHFNFIWGGRWGGKSISIGKIVLNWSNNKKLRNLCTREIQNSIKDSVHADLSRLIYDLNYNNYKITDNNIYNSSNDSEFVFRGLYNQDKKQTIKSFSNIDVCWIEEAQSVSKGSLDILIPTIRKEGSILIFSYNVLFPDDPVDMLRRSIPDEEKNEINITCFDNPFLSDESLNDIKRLKQQYEAGENQDYLHVVLGQPITISDFTVFRINEIQDAMSRAISDKGQIVVGIDIARMGGDKTIFVKRKGLKMIDYKTFPVMTGDLLIKEIVTFINNDVTIKINIDETGIAGGYIADFLQSKGFKKVSSINFGKSAKDSDKYNNAISEMWFEFKSKINDVQLMNIPELKTQLITREYKYDNKERKCIEPKDQYKKRGYKSPDFADAVLLCYYEIMAIGSKHQFMGRAFR